MDEEKKGAFARKKSRTVSLAPEARTPSKLMRRPTGYLRPADVQQILENQRRKLLSQGQEPSDEEPEEDDAEIYQRLESAKAAARAISVTKAVPVKEKKRAVFAEGTAMPPESESSESESESGDDSDRQGRKERSISLKVDARTPSRMMRRPTGYLHAGDIKQILKNKREKYRAQGLEVSSTDEEEEEDEFNDENLKDDPEYHAWLKAAEKAAQEADKAARAAAVAKFKEMERPVKEKKRAVFAEGTALPPESESSESESESGDDSDRQGRKERSISLKVDTRTPSRMMRRPTGYLHAGDIKQILKNKREKYRAQGLEVSSTDEEEEEDEFNDENLKDDPEYHAWLKAAEKAAQEADKAARAAAVAKFKEMERSKIKRRQTGLMPRDQLKKLLQKDLEEEEEQEEKHEEIREESVETKAPRVCGVKAKRRQTGFVTPDQLRQLLHDDLEDEEEEEKKEESRHVSEDTCLDDQRPAFNFVERDPRASTVFIPTDEEVIDEEDSGKKRHVHVDKETCKRPSKLKGLYDTEFYDYDEERARRSVIRRLYEEVTDKQDFTLPTLKEYRPLTERIPQNLFLTFGTKLLTEESRPARKPAQPRVSVVYSDESFEKAVEKQFGKAPLDRNISTEYVHKISQIEHERIEVAQPHWKKRPTMTVEDYRKRNLQRQKEITNLQSKGSHEARKVHSESLKVHSGSLKVHSGFLPKLETSKTICHKTVSLARLESKVTVLKPVSGHDSPVREKSVLFAIP